MHVGLGLLILTLGTFWFFPRLAKLLVGMGLVGVLAFVLVAVGQGMKQDKARARLEQEAAAHRAQVQAAEEERCNTILRYRHPDGRLLLTHPDGCAPLGSAVPASR